MNRMMTRAELVEHYADVRRRISADPELNSIRLPPTPKKHVNAPSKFKWTGERVETLKRMWEAGDKAEVIASTIGGGCTAYRVINKRRALGLPVRHVVTKRSRLLSAPERVEFTKLWLKGRSIKFIAKRFGLTVDEARAKRDHYKLPARNTGSRAKNLERQNLRMMFYVTEDVRAKIMSRATRLGLSMSTYLSRIIENAVENDKRGGSKRKHKNAPVVDDSNI